METTHYSYNGKSWRSTLTISDHNSFFHSVFGVKINESGAYFDKQAEFRRLQLTTFLTYFKNENMPSCLADILRKCSSVNGKFKEASVDDGQNLTNYISHLAVNEQGITKEDIPVLATLENIKIVVLSKGEVTVIEPNPNIFGSYPKEAPKEKPREVVLSLEENIFTRLEPVREEQRPKPNKNKVEKKTDPSKYKKGGSAGSKGVEYQVSLIAMVMLKAMRNGLGGWRLSTENDEAGKFDDIVMEWTEGAVLIQSKYKEDSKKRITLEELTSTNSKKDDFSLPKYFLSYMLIKDKFNVKNIILCTNAGIHEKALKFLNPQTANTDSLLHYEEGECSFYTFNDTVLPVLKEKAIEYYDQNLKNGGVQKSVITEENLTDFLKSLQLYCNYPPLKELQKITEKLLSATEYCYNPQGKITSLEVYSKVMDWFQQKDGVYLTEIHAKAMFAEIWTNKYCEKLKQYKVSFEKNDLNFHCPKRIFRISSSHGQFLQAIKVYYAVQNEKILFVNPDDNIDTQKLILEAFALPQYVFLIINQLKVIEESVIKDMSEKLRNILVEKKYKKVILITRIDDLFYRYLGHREDDCEIIDGPVTFADFSRDFQEKLLKRKSVVFQGKSVCLEKLSAGRKTEDYASAVAQDILENIITGEVKVGVQPLDMDEKIAQFYINRTFIRSMENIYEDNIYEVNENVILISDSAGVGKSTVLSKLATNIKERYPHLWVIKIALTEYTYILRDLRNSRESINIMKLLNSKSATKLTSCLEKCVFYMDKSVVLMFDGIDEISPDYTELVHNLLIQCLRATNFAKLFVTTRPHMVQELKKLLKVDPFELQPLTEQNQMDFLIGYWTHKLDIARENKGKCEEYARALIERISSWTKGDYYGKDKFTAIALQLRMVAEIFQETIKLNQSDWESCKEYLESANERPNLPRKIEMKELYDLFIETKRNIYVHKGNPTGTPEANTLLVKQFNKSLNYHRILALEMILSEKVCRLFSCYHEICDDITESILKIGIVRSSNEGFCFIHRTFAEYFVAESLCSELQLQSQNANVKFQEFFIDSVLARTNYEIIRSFLDSFLQKVVDFIPSNIFKSYQFRSTQFLPRFYGYWIVNLLAREGCAAILKLILKCIDFKSVKDETHYASIFANIFDNNSYNTYRRLELLLQTMKRENIAVNMLNVLKIVLQILGLEVKESNGITPLMAAAAASHLEMVGFLIDQGAKVNNAGRNGFTALHLAVNGDRMDIVRYLVEHGAEIDCRNERGYTPLHIATLRTDLKCIKYLTESGANISMKDDRDRTLLHFAAMRRQFNLIDSFVEQNDTYYDISSNYPTDLTVRRKQWDIIEFLVECNGDINIKDEDGCTPLHTAVMESHLDTVKLLHRLGGDLNIRNNHDRMVLHLAAEFGHLDCVQYLIKFNKVVDIKDSDGRTPLFLAASEGHIDVVKFLQQQNANCNVKDSSGKTVLHVLVENRRIDEYFIKFVTDIDAKDNNGCTALHLATERHCTDAINLLCKVGADLNIKNGDDKTPLHLAAESGYLRTVKTLHELGAHLNIRDSRGRTALHSAAAAGYLDVVKYLVEAGVDLNITDDRNRKALHSAIVSKNLNLVQSLLGEAIDLNIRGHRGRTALHSAAASGHLDLVEYVLKEEADLNITDDHGRTALHSAAACGHLDVVMGLLEAGADLSITDERDKTALHSAAAYGHLSVVNYLLEAGADLNVTDDRGRTALHSAAACGHLEIVVDLLGSGADLSIIDDRRRTALHSAAASGCLSVVEYLVVAGADLNVTNDRAMTVLHSAVACGRLDLAKYLHLAGASLNITDDRGRTTLHSAAACGRLELVKYLLGAGASLNITDNRGRTALHSAAISGHLNVVQYLVEADADFTIKDKDNRSPMQLASLKHHLQIVSYLENKNK